MKTDLVDIFPYERRYHRGVIDCLKRNFPKLNAMEKSQLSEWLNSIVMCDWYEGEESYKHGYVIVHDDTVVGYCGLLLSYIQHGDKNLKYANLTTWALDEPYRFSSFRVLTEILEQMDVVSDFTPSSIVERINSRLYGFQYFSRKAYKFKHEKNRTNMDFEISIIKMTDITSWSNITVKKYYNDHVKYGCEGLYISMNNRQDELYFMFYTPVSSSEWVNTIYVSNIDMFTKCLYQVVKEVYMNYERGIICDEIFLNPNFLDSISYAQTNRSRMIFTKENNVNIPGLLYSELPVLRY